MKRLLVLLLLLTLLGGCYLDPSESLYAVPQQPASYYDLQSAIERFTDRGASFCAPTAGENQQAIHLTNLDDDAEEEAIVYLKTDGDAPLMLCVFDRRADRYVLAGKAEGAGYAFDSALYLSIDETPGHEIVIGRKISDGVPQVLSVYALREDGLTELMSTNYAEYITADLDSDGKRELIALHTDGDAQNGVAEYYRWEDGEIVRAKETNLSASVDAIKRISTGKLCEDVPAVFVGSSYGEGIVTDVLVLREGSFVNVTLSEQVSTSVPTLRGYYVYSCDIDDDGLVELPRLQPLASLAGDEDSDGQWLISWYNLHPDGTREDKCLTYHNYAAGWYVKIPSRWENTLAVTRADGAVSFVDSQTEQELFAITTVSEEKMRRSNDEWHSLAQKGEVSYACRFNKDAGVSLSLLKELFRFIRVDWNTGET